MRMKSWMAVWLIGLCVLGAVSCSEDEKVEDVYPLTFEKGSYRLRLNLPQSIPVLGGSKSYSLQVGDPELLEAKITFLSTIGFGEIEVTPKQKGRTAMLVTDQVSGETKKLDVEVTDFYMGFSIVESSDASLPVGEALFFVENEKHDCFLIRQNDDISLPVLDVAGRGDYAFSVEEGLPYLTLHLQAEDSETPETRVFDISASKTEIMVALNRWYGLEWDALRLRSASRPESTFLIMKDAKNTIRCRVIGTDLPEELVR